MQVTGPAWAVCRLGIRARANEWAGCVEARHLTAQIEPKRFRSESHTYEISSLESSSNIGCIKNEDGFWLEHGFFLWKLFNPPPELCSTHIQTRAPCLTVITSPADTTILRLNPKNHHKYLPKGLPP